MPPALYPLSFLVISSPFFSGVTLPCAEPWILIFYPLVHLLSVSRGFFSRGFDLSSLASEVSPVTFSHLLCVQRHSPYSFFSLIFFLSARAALRFFRLLVGLDLAFKFGEKTQAAKNRRVLAVDGRASDSKRIGTLFWRWEKCPWTSAPFWDLLLAT